MTQESVCELLVWDTAFFGQRIARVIPGHLTQQVAAEIDKWVAEHRIDGLYFLAAADDPATIRLAETHGYRLQDVRMVFGIDLTSATLQPPDLAPDFTQGYATAADTDILRPLTQDTFTDTRFYNDPHFTVEQCNRLYETWLIRSIEEDFADAVIKLSHQGRACAYVTCTLNVAQQVGTIGLLGVAGVMRGRKLGQHLVQAALYYFQQNGMQSAQVVTQASNIAAQRLYQHCGFRTIEARLWYHKWFTSEEVYP
jgi:dTDP-4-amino-4,6-dideoxy-D-galactose acyltransferase